MESLYAGTGMDPEHGLMLCVRCVLLAGLDDAGEKSMMVGVRRVPVSVGSPVDGSATCLSESTGDGVNRYWTKQLGRLVD